MACFVLDLYSCRARCGVCGQYNNGILPVGAAEEKRVEQKGRLQHKPHEVLRAAW